MTKRHPKPTKEQNAGRAIRKAAEVLADRRWIQKSVGTPNTGMCAIGAIRFAINDRLRGKLYYDTEETFAEWLYENGYVDMASIPRWNDAKNRTKEEVLLYMNKFADEMDPQHP